MCSLFHLSPSISSFNFLKLFKAQSWSVIQHGSQNMPFVPMSVEWSKIQCYQLCYHSCDTWPHLNFEGDSIINVNLFRWFKFTLKPSYSIMYGKLWLTIWDTSFWTFWVKFRHKGPWDIYWSFLKYVTFWQFQGHLSTFQKMGDLKKSKFSWWRSNHYPPLIGLVLGGEVPRLNHGPICFPIQNT